MLLTLKIILERNCTGRDYARIKRGIEKMGYVCHLRPNDVYPSQIIIEGAETSAELFKILNKECAPV
jgi:hypothetical protein